METDKTSFEIHDNNNKLNIDNFTINNDMNQKKQPFLHYILYQVILEYNNYQYINDEDKKKNPIYFLKEDKVLLANISDKYIKDYLDYKNLLADLLDGKDNYSVSNSNDKSDKSKSYGGINYNTSELDERKKIQNNLNNFSNYYNGIFLEEVATKSFLSFFDNITIFPRIVYYMDGKDVDNIHTGYNELDFIFYNKDNDVKIPKEKFVTFKMIKKKTVEFYKTSNFSDIEIKRNSLVFIEVKTTWPSLLSVDKNGKKKGISKLSERYEIFLNYFLKLHLVKEDVKIYLIFIYNNSMAFNIESEFNSIINIFDSLKSKKNVELIISYIMPYTKLLNYCNVNKKIKDLEEIIEKEKEERQKLEEENKLKMKEERKKIEEGIKTKLEEEIKTKMKEERQKFEEIIKQQKEERQKFEEIIKQQEKERQKFIEIINQQKEEKQKFEEIINQQKEENKKLFEEQQKKFNDMLKQLLINSEKNNNK